MLCFPMDFFPPMANLPGCQTALPVWLQDMLNFWGTALQAVLNGTLLYQCIQTARLPPGKLQELQLLDSSGPAQHSKVCSLVAFNQAVQSKMYVPM